GGERHRNHPPHQQQPAQDRSCRHAPHHPCRLLRRSPVVARLTPDACMNNAFTLPAHLGHNAPSIPTDLLIGDRWSEAAGGQRFDVEDPSTGRSLTSVADGTVEDGIAAVSMAHAAAGNWASTPARVRSEILRKCYERIVANAQWLASLISLENGKTLADARSEVLYAAEFFRWYAEEAPRVLGEFATAPSGANHIVVRYQP